MDREELTGRLRAMKYLNVALYETAGVAADLIDQQAARIVELEAALREIIERWETPLWKNVEPTGYVIARACKVLEDKT